MTLTPAQQVALDALREAFDEATVARMARAIEPDIETAVARVGDWLFAHVTAADFVGDLADDDAVSTASSAIEQGAMAAGFPSAKPLDFSGDRTGKELPF